MEVITRDKGGINYIQDLSCNDVVVFLDKWGYNEFINLSDKIKKIYIFGYKVGISCLINKIRTSWI